MSRHAGYTRIAALDAVLCRLEAATSRDEHDVIMSELAKIAPKHIGAIRDLFEANRYYRMALIWSLIGQTNEAAVSLFARAIVDRDPYTRWAAAEALAKCRTRRASSLLVAALKDRAHLVKQTAIEAMTRLRDPAAVAQLKKIIASEHLQRTAPGMVKAAREALRACR